MGQLDTHIKLMVDMLSQVLRCVNRTVLSACAAETHHQVGEVALLISLYRLIYQCIYVNEPLVDRAFFLQELDDVIV